MTRFMLLTGAAALAIASAATAAPQGNNDRSAKTERADRPSGKTKATAKRSEARVAKAAPRAKADVRAAKVEVRRDNRQAERAARVDRRVDRAETRREMRDDRRLATAERRFDRQSNRNFERAALGYGTGGCPPGLAKKPVACMPPGQARNLLGQPLNKVRQVLNLRELPSRLRTVYSDNDDYYYRYGNGYMYQVDRKTSLISSLLPLFGLGVPIGQTFPSAYSNYMVPSAYQPFYQDTSDHYYRYGDGYVYQVGRNDGLVMDYMPLLASGYGYGQMMPASYSAYNVPNQYRSFYQDNDDHYYRYAPGSIYRVDAGSGLIDSVAALLMTGGMQVGQPMPMGYQTYNMPMQYRSQYYDTPDNMYRYSNGNIYQVDPTTRLVTALISALI